MIEKTEAPAEASIESLSKDVRALREEHASLAQLVRDTANHVLSLHQKVTLPFRTRAALTLAGSACGAGAATLLLELGLRVIQHVLPLIASN